MGETPIRLANSTDRSLKDEKRRWLTANGCGRAALGFWLWSHSTNRRPPIGSRDAAPSPLLLLQHRRPLFVGKDRALELPERRGLVRRYLHLANHVFALVVELV